jgi:WD40 repeat protein/tetratricopeptide (TPR) repeat protein
LLRWLTRRRTGVTGVAAAVLAGVVGLAAVLAVQTQANSQLSASLTRETRASAALAAANAKLIDEQAKVEARNKELAAEQAKATQAREIAQAERQQAVTNLYHARVEEAAALRRARSMGYRAQVFYRLQQALRLDTPDKDNARLRQEAVACLGDFVGLEPITWEDFPADVLNIALTPDGERMAIALSNGTIQLRTVSTGRVVALLSELTVHLGMDPANRCLVTAGVNRTIGTRTIKVWPDYGTAAAPAAQTIEIGANLAGMARNGRFAVTYSQEQDGGVLSLWDLARQQVRARLNFPSEAGVRDFQVSDDGQWVAQAFQGGTKLYALVWNTPAPEPKKIFFADTSQPTRPLAISPDGRILACMHGSDGLILLDLQESVPRPLIRSDEVEAAGFSGDGRFLVYYSASGRVRLWSVSRHQEVADLAHPPKGHQWLDFLATFSADGNTFATAQGHSRSVRIWKLDGSGEKLVLSGHTGGIPCVAFSPDGEVLASGSKDRSVKLWDTATGRLLRTLPRFDSPIQSIAFSPDGRLLATGQWGLTPQPVQAWDLATLQTNALPDDELGRCAYGVAFSPDGKFLAACGDGLTLWRVAEGEQGAGDGPRLSFKRVAHLPGQRSSYLRISPNGKLLAWVDHDSSVCLWDLVKAREIPFPGPPLDFGWHNLAFYPDSDHLTFEARGMVETWDTRTVHWVSSLGKKGGVAASPDGRWLMDAELTLWSAQTGSRVFSFPQETGLTWSLAFSPDGERLAVGQADGGLVIWGVPKIQAQLTRIGLAWRADARPQQREPQPFVPATPLERNHQVAQYRNLGFRLASVGRLAEAEEAYRAALALGRRLAEDNPAVPDFRNNLASSQNNLGFLLAQRGKPTEAEAELREALAISQKLADDNPTVPAHRAAMSIVLPNLAGVVRSLGRAAEARDGYDRAIVLGERLVREEPTSAEYRSNLARSLRCRGLARGDLGEGPGAAADARRALGLYEGLPSRSGEQWFQTACCHAALRGLSGHDGAAVSAAEAQDDADKAIAALKRAAALGYRNAHAWGTDSALDPLRSRDEFRLLLMDVAFPAEPFAATR